MTAHFHFFRSNKKTDWSIVQRCQRTVESIQCGKILLNNYNNNSNNINNNNNNNNNKNNNPHSN